MQIYLSIQDDRQGPFTPEEIAAKLQSGECTPETLAWKEGLEAWQPLRDVLPQSETAPPPPLPVTPPSLPSAPPSTADVPKKENGFVSFFLGYRGLLQRLKASPAPQASKWFDNFALILPVAFFSLCICGIGLVPLWLTSRLSTGDKGRLSLFALWPVLLANPPLFIFFALIVGLVILWLKPLFTLKIRLAVTGAVAGAFVLLVGVAVLLVANDKREAEAKFQSDPSSVLAHITAEAIEVRASSGGTVANANAAIADAEAVIKKYGHIQDERLQSELSKLRSAITETKAKVASQASKQESSQRQLSKLKGIAGDAFGPHEFKRIENSGDASESVEFLQVHVQPSRLEAKWVCLDILEFFVEALDKKALEGVEFVTFHFHGDLVHQNGKEENAEVLRIALSRKMIQSTNWKGYDKYLHIDLVKRQLLSEADDKFFISKLDWQELGWRD